jgi:hypothetical protein
VSHRDLLVLLTIPVFLIVGAAALYVAGLTVDSTAQKTSFNIEHLRAQTSAGEHTQSPEERIRLLTQTLMDVGEIQDKTFRDFGDTLREISGLLAFLAIVQICIAASIYRRLRREHSRGGSADAKP